MALSTAPSRSLAQTAAPRTSAARRRAARRVLARYVAPIGVPREVVALDGAAGCVLVVDRSALTRDDARLVAHLSPDEPPENAAIASALFVRHARDELVRCRPVVSRDFAATTPAEGLEAEASSTESRTGPIRDQTGRTYRLEAVAGAMSIPELRWRVHAFAELAPCGEARTVSVREAVAELQAYEPIRSLTRLALARHRGRGRVSVAVLRLELARVLSSPIVLNYKLRETVLRTLAEQQITMSEIAIRCGRVKRDRTGNISGETSWLARRLGLLPEGGRERPTPWIHTQVLALIARRGLGVSPREVEPD